MGIGIKISVKRDDWSGTFQTISRHFQFFSSMDVLYSKFGRRAFSRATDPEIQVSFFAGFKKDKVFGSVCFT
jgi:hypothetical protein